MFRLFICSLKQQSHESYLVMTHKILYYTTTR